MRNKGNPKKLAPKLHIFCEGGETEPNYLQHYLGLCGVNDTPRDRVVLIEKRKKTTPVQLVEESIDKKKSYPASDQVWVVYDRESEVKYVDALHNNARQKASAQSVNIALSNVCFEVWLLLHFQKTASRAYSSCRDLIKYSTLTTHIPGYEKNITFSFTKEQIAKARKNAKAMNKTTIAGASPGWTQPHQWNPYTNVYELLDKIDKFLL